MVWCVYGAYDKQMVMVSMASVVLMVLVAYVFRFLMVFGCPLVTSHGGLNILRSLSYILRLKNLHKVCNFFPRFVI